MNNLNSIFQASFYAELEKISQDSSKTIAPKIIRAMDSVGSTIRGVAQQFKDDYYKPDRKIEKVVDSMRIPKPSTKKR